MIKRSFTHKAEEVIFQAILCAQKTGQSYVGTEHMLMALVLESGTTAGEVLNRHGISYDAVLSLADCTDSGEADFEDEGDFTPKALQIMDRANAEAEKFRSEKIGTEHLLIAIIKEEDCAANKLLSGLGGNRQKIYASLLTAMGEDLQKYKAELQPEGEKKQKKHEGILGQFSTDMCRLAKDGKTDPIIGREEEIARVVQILSRRTKNNPCLVGEPGVGKTSIVEALAEKIAKGGVSGPVSEKRILSLDLPAMVAGSKYRGEFEERVKKIINEVKNAGDIIIFMDEIHTLIGAGGAEGSIDAANILKPALSKGEIQIIGATTADEYRRHFEKDAALARRFQPVYVEQPAKEECVKILKGLRGKYEEHHQVKIEDEAIEASVALSIRYINDRFLPDKAIDLLDEASSKVKLDSYILPPEYKKMEDKIKILEVKREERIKNGRFNKASDIGFEISQLKWKIDMYEGQQKGPDFAALRVTPDDIADVVSKWTRIPVKKLAEEESAKLLGLNDTLKKRVVAQDAAVDALSKAIRRGRAGLKDPKKPIGSFLFLGPTGVGKTELCKALAEAMFGTENSIIRVDLSEYMEKHSVSKLIGSPPGYVGFEEGGQLSEQVRRNPYSIVLFDEIEKAHPDVFNILLQVLDDGRITDSHGRVTDFKNTIIIMTSNAGAQRIMEPKNLGFMADESEEDSYKIMKEAVLDEIKRTFRPEFLNRIDETIVFRALNREDMVLIADIILNEIISRAAGQMQLKITVTDAAKSLMADQGFEKKFGARPLKRKIQSVLEDELAEEILEGKIKAGDRVRVDEKDGRLTFKATAKPGRKAKNG